MSDQETKLSHLTDDGSATMVDVGGKSTTQRKAIARSVVELSPKTFALLQKNALPKGDVLTVAKIAGIQAAKRTSSLIPLCHPLFLTYVDVTFETDAQTSTITITAESRTTGQTGVEMEALTAAQVAALTIYDMCKAVQKDIILRDCRLLHKSGGKSGTYDAS